MPLNFRSLTDNDCALIHRSHVEAQAHSVILLAQVAHSLQGAVATHGGNGLQDLQQVLALKGEGQPVGRARHIHVGAEERRLDLDGRR